MDDGDSAEQVMVMSEVHLGCPPDHSGPLISNFTISIPSVEYSRYRDLFRGEATPTCISLDADGDLILTRRSHLSTHSFRVTIQHNLTSSIPSVGLQVWRAELVLSDFLLHKMLTSAEFDEIICLELGAGTGLVGILLACVAKTVFLTDRDDEILDNCAMNVNLNSGLFNRQAAVNVRELNWMNTWPPKTHPDKSAFKAVASRYSWTSKEIEEAQRASLLVAADVIYSDDLTDALFSIVKKLMSSGSEKVLYLALEKRYNFSLDDLDVVANGYSHFRSYVIDEGECESIQHASSHRFLGKRIDLEQIPKYVQEYDRGNDVEIWQIKYKYKRKSLS